jgi:hypothetical protein
MRHLTITTICTLALLIAALHPVAEAEAAPPFIGKWRAHSMEVKGKPQSIPKGITITLEFKAGGKWIGRVELKGKDKKGQAKVDRGTWKLEGKTLTTYGKQTDVMTYTIDGNTLTLRKKGKGETLILKRL